MKYSTLLLVALVAMPAAAQDESSQSDNPAPNLAPITALTALIANPDRYHGTRVLTGGYYLGDGPMHALCLQPRAASSLDCLHIKLQSPAEFEQLRGQSVYVEGLFQNANSEHRGRYSGIITPERLKKTSK